MSYWSKADIALAMKDNQIAFLKTICRIAADRLENGGTFPIQGETWELLDFAAGDVKKAAHPSHDAASSERKEP